MKNHFRYILLSLLTLSPQLGFAEDLLDDETTQRVFHYADITSYNDLCDSIEIDFENFAKSKIDEIGNLIYQDDSIRLIYFGRHYYLLRFRNTFTADEYCSRGIIEYGPDGTNYKGILIPKEENPPSEKLSQEQRETIAHLVLSSLIQTYCLTSRVESDSTSETFQRFNISWDDAIPGGRLGPYLEVYQRGFISVLDKLDTDIICDVGKLMYGGLLSMPPEMSFDNPSRF